MQGFFDSSQRSKRVLVTEESAFVAACDRRNYFSAVSKTKTFYHFCLGVGEGHIKITTEQSYVSKIN
jgi:hypothetical protein